MKAKEPSTPLTVFGSQEGAVARVVLVHFSSRSPFILASLLSRYAQPSKIRTWPRFAVMTR